MFMIGMEQIMQKYGLNEKDFELARVATKEWTKKHLELTHWVRTCEFCDLSLHCYGQKDLPVVTTERIVGSGSLNADLMLVGSVPTEIEAKFHSPFVGEEGLLLHLLLQKANIDYSSIYMTYAIKCATPNKPSKEHIEVCLKHLNNEIKHIQPKVILAIGDVAYQAVSSAKSNAHVFHVSSLTDMTNKEDKIKIWSVFKEVKSALAREE